MTPPLVVEFDVPGEPRGKGTVRSSVIYGRGGLPVMKDGRAIIVHSTDDKTVAYESLIKHRASLAMAGRPPVDSPVRVDLVVIFAVPASWSGRRRDMALVGEIRPARKPDMSNTLKAAEDGMNAVVFADDALIVEGTQRKVYGRTPGLRIRVSLVGADAAQMPLDVGLFAPPPPAVAALQDEALPF